MHTLIRLQLYKGKARVERSSFTGCSVQGLLAESGSCPKHRRELSDRVEGPTGIEQGQESVASLSSGQTLKSHNQKKCLILGTDALLLLYILFPPNTREQPVH